MNERSSTPYRLRLGEAPSLFHSSLAALRPREVAPPEAPAPHLEVAVARVPIEAEQIAAYRSFCGFPTSAQASMTVPPPYLFSLAYPTLVALLVHPEMPLRALGMVHTGFDVEVTRSLVAGEAPSLAVRMVDWRPVPAGREVETAIEVFDESSSETIARARVTTVARSKQRRDRTKKESTARREAPGGDSSPVVLAADAGRRFARVSGDWNPIHLWPWSARLLGLRRPIAHGMYLVARSVAILGERFGFERVEEARRLAVRFKTPAYLPGGARLFSCETEADDDLGFELWSADRSRPHLFGTLSGTPTP